MKQKQLIFCMGLSAIALLTSCNEHEFEFPSEGSKETEKGTLVLNLNASASFEQTRAVNENDYENVQDYMVKVIDLNQTEEKTLFEDKYSKLSTFLPKTLEMGSYKIKAYYGTEHNASRDEFYMYGEATVQIDPKDEKVVSVDCTPTCGKISVSFDSAMDTYYKEYNVSFAGTKKLGNTVLPWKVEGSEPTPWYVALDEGGETVSYTIDLTTKDEYLDSNTQSTTGQVTGSFKLERNKAHKLTIAPNYIPTTEGGMKLTIKIEEQTNDHSITWEVPVTWI